MTAIQSMLHGEAIQLGAKGEVVRLIQTALRSDGQELVDDGDYGLITRAAVLRFQAAHHLDPDGVVGPKTAVALDLLLIAPTKSEPPLASVLEVAPHLATMRAITGTREIPGAKDSPIILAWREVIAAHFPEMRQYAMGYTHDSIPWCGFGLAYCCAVNGIRPVFGPIDVERFMYAQAWGHDCPDLIRLKPPYPQGAIMVYTRNGGGHVSLLEETGDGWDNIRGCNQSDMVNVVAKSRMQFTAATWPRHLPIPSEPAPRARVRGKLASSEA